ncbi:peptidoglycan-binding protein [Streptomyces sp. NPDC046821]|uniref:peptidoglycan-binding protein n=1 Tax=Streptomyces sp. NPDC046821 TaxID=3154702 RepID=UPI0033C4E168
MTESTAESTSDRRSKLDGLCLLIPLSGSKNHLIGLIERALGVRAPVGDPATIEALGTRYTGQTDEADAVRKRIDRVARKGLPQAWVGETSVLASEVVSAATRDVDQLIEAFRRGGTALVTLADALTAAQALDAAGRVKLHDARTMLGGKDNFLDDLIETDEEEALRKRARALATAGVEDLCCAAADIDDAARAAARELNKFAAEARAGHMATDELTAADRLVLADTSNTRGDRELNEILSANDLARAGSAMEKLSPDERARMEALLASAKSPQERAYLMKALAAGYGIADVETFGQKIQGKDAVWLQSHLAPVTTGFVSLGDTREDQGFRGEKWAQDGSTCVPSSTVTARAYVDPVYALQLTGGPTGQDEDPAHFRDRLHDEQNRMHWEGDGSWKIEFPDVVPTGMDPDGQEEISDKELGPHTGDSYEPQEMKTPADRRDILPDIEKSVAEGRPVPVNISSTVDGEHHGHSLIIIGQEGDRLQVYNPWGATSWISEDQFIRGDLESVTDDRFSKEKHNADLNTVYIKQG